MIKSINFENTILPCLGKTAKLTGYYFIDILKKNGLDLSKEQWLVLKKLNDNDGLCQNELAFITNRSKTSLTRLIQTIEKKGLVFRVNSEEDKRKNHIYLSETGRSTFLESLPFLHDLVQDLQKGISEKELENTIKTLNKIQNNIHKINNL